MKAYTRVPVGVQGGLNKDIPPQNTQANEFSEVHNLRMKDKRLELAQGHTEIFEPVPQPPEHVLGVIQNEVATLFIAGNGQLHKNQNAIWEDVSRLVGGAYSTVGKWQSAVLNGCIFMNNGEDTLQVLETADTDFKDSVSLTSGLTAKVFRGFKNYLFALNLTISGTDYPQSLRWSDPADPGTEPPSWDITDPTTQAGDNILADTDGYLVDAQQLRDQLIIYKSDAVYSCQFVGGVYVFSFQKILSDRGCLSEGCVSSFENKHFVVGFDDIYIHDGLQASSISEGRIKDFFYQDLDQDYLDNAFTVRHQKEKEIWVCYPNDQAVNGSCNQALVWNWVTNTWSSRDIPNLSHAALAVIDPQSSDVWDTGTDVSWDLGDLHWDANSYSPANLSLVLASKDDDKLYQVNDGATFNGTTFEFTLEKLSSDIGAEDNIKHLNHLTPDITGSGTLNVRLGSQYKLGEGVLWKPTLSYPVGDYRLYSKVSGRYLSLNFSGDTVNVLPSIGSADIHITMEGEK